MAKTFVTKSFLPPFEEYEKLIRQIYENGILTNQGALLKQFEEKLSNYLDAKHFHFITNGTLALQLALSSLDINDGEVITTPFSYVATVSSILWQRCTPVFVDIEPDNLTIDTSKIQQAITSKTRAIMGVHVFGYACDVDKIQNIADKHNLKVIYDAAHTFGAKYKGKSLANYGDVSMLSFHATKLFHTIEGGACIVKDKDVSDKLGLQKTFGHKQDDHFCLGINAKANEFQAAMGLAIFPYIRQIIQPRKQACDMYDKILDGIVKRPKNQSGLEYNYAYYPVIFKDEQQLLDVFKALNAADIFPRRYFYPSLNTLPYINTASPCPVSEDISKRIACLPLWTGMDDGLIEKICDIIIKVAK